MAEEVVAEIVASVLEVVVTPGQVWKPVTPSSSWSR